MSCIQDSGKTRLVRRSKKQSFHRRLAAQYQRALEKEKLDAFEGDGDDVHIHAYRGAFLVSAFYPQPDISPILYYHHYHWQDGNVLSDNPDMPMDSQLVYLADRVCTLIATSDEFVLSQIPDIKQYVTANTGSHFCPVYSEAVLELLSVESVWLDVFAALREKRPYKEPFTKEEILSILKSMADSGTIDSNVVGVLTDNYPVLEDVCVQAEISARHAYDQLYQIQG